MFDTVRRLLELYYLALLKKGAGARAEHLLHELRGRLRGLQWVYARLVALDLQFDAEVRAEITGDQPDVLKQVFTDAWRPRGDGNLDVASPLPSDELRVLLEAFYYSAHRVRCILRDCRAELPGIGSFEAAGVRNVRNHLVEHPDQKGGVVLFSIATGGPVGPQMKPMRWSLDPTGTADAGLHANTLEFVAALERALQAGIDALALQR